MIGNASIPGPQFSGLCRQKKDMITTTTVMTIRKHVSIRFAILSGKKKEWIWSRNLRDELEFDVRFYGKNERYL